MFVMDHLLSIVTFLPLFGALIILLTVRGSEQRANRNAAPAQ